MPAENAAAPPPSSATPRQLPPLSSPPFLVWPVSQREFYRTICLALVPSLAWGIVLFGSRTLAMLLFAMGTTTFTYLLVKRVLKWHRAQPLLYMHCLASALVLVALAHPTWPIWTMTSMALLLPLVLGVIGGSGKERIHVAVAAVLAVQYILLPSLPARMYAGRPDAILARDRLFMGDIRDQAPDPVMSFWPSSRDLAGNDAVPFTPPALSAANTLDQISDLLPSLDQSPPAPVSRRPLPPTTAAPRPVLSIPPDSPAVGLSKADLNRIGDLLDRAFVKRLPGIESFLWGIAPNRVGAASVIALTLAGLYLSYRYILRPRSVLFFLAVFILATAGFLFTPPTYQRVGPLVIWELVKQFPGQFVTLFNFLLLNSDAAFAGVVILALPGTEPLTARGRRIFLAVAGIGAAGLHRLDPTTPAATLTLCLLMPTAPLFDHIFTQRSWLNGKSSTR